MLDLIRIDNSGKPFYQHLFILFTIFLLKIQFSAPTGAPLKPRVNSVTQTRSDFMWNEPDCELRNGKITGYEWQLESSDPWGENKTGHSTTQRESFDDLVPYTQYRVRILAENSAGQGPWSEWISFRTQPAGRLVLH